MAGATYEELSDVIKSLGFYKTKAKHCIACAQMSWPITAVWFPTR